MLPLLSIICSEVSKLHISVHLCTCTPRRWRKDACHGLRKGVTNCRGLSQLSATQKWQQRSSGFGQHILDSDHRLYIAHKKHSLHMRISTQQHKSSFTSLHLHALQNSLALPAHVVDVLVRDPTLLKRRAHTTSLMNLMPKHLLCREGPKQER
jgi:hypothetical protein